MDDGEFARFVDRCQSVFSSVDRMVQDDGWLDRSDAWRKALAPVDAALAAEYVDAVVSGRIPAPRYPSDWDLFPSDVRVWCQSEEGRRSPPPPKKKPRVDANRRSVFRDELRRCGFSSLADRLDKSDPLPA